MPLLENDGDGSAPARRVFEFFRTAAVVFLVGRVEDLAGMMIALIIIMSAVVAGYESIERFFNPQPISHIWAVVAASVIGFVGNEGVAIFRVRVGHRI